MPAPPDHVPEQQLRDSYIKHAARAQLHRYLDYASRPFEARAALLDLLADDIAVAGLALARPTPVGELTDCRIVLQSADAVSATVKDPAIAAIFRRGSAFLPQLTSITIDGAGGHPLSAVAHRVRATVHYFIALVENPARDPEPFRELLADQFSLHYTPEPLKDFEAVRGWVTGRLASVVASEHDIRSITVTESDDGTSTAVVTMKSQALFPNSSGAISRNTQHWTLTDTRSNDRFPRVTEVLIDRDAVEFFGPAPDYEPREMPG